MISKFIKDVLDLYQDESVGGFQLFHEWVEGVE